MSGKRGEESARLVVAKLFGEAYHHAGWEEPTEEETMAAVAELQELVAGRPDGVALLCEVAGVILGAHEGRLDEPRARNAARFLLAAGAGQDEQAVAGWAEKGRERSANAARPPFGGVL